MIVGIVYATSIDFARKKDWKFLWLGFENLQISDECFFFFSGLL